jgi:transposase
MSNLFWLTDAQMARLERFFPKSHGKPRVDDRRVLSGIIFINRNGLRRCDAPREYGPPKTLYKGSDAGEGRIVRYGLVLGPARCKVL